MLSRTLLLLLISCAGGISVAQTTQPARQVDLLAMGDWGTGGTDQKEVAAGLANYVSSQQLPIAGLLSAGDNFYNHMTGIDDPEWQNRFENMYDPSILNFPFHMTLGNHDYEKDESPIQLEYAKANPQSRFKLPSRWYRLDFPQDNPLVTVLMLDSNMKLMGEAMWAEQTKWIAAQLAAERKSKWLIAVAHHPFYSNGSHGDNGVLLREWGGMLISGKADAYVCGHDHDLQHLEFDFLPISLILCGGGGAKVRPMAVDKRGPFSKSVYGFVHLSFSEDQVRVKFLDKAQNVLHEFTRDPRGKVDVLRTTQSDVAVPRTPKSITRGDDGQRTSPATTQAR